VLNVLPQIVVERHGNRKTPATPARSDGCPEILCAH
jgi:hypothetical protein